MLKSLGQTIRNVSLRHFSVDLVIITLSVYVSLYLRVGFEGLDQHLETANLYRI